MKTVALSDTDIKVLSIFFDNCNPCRRAKIGKENIRIIKEE